MTSFLINGLKVMHTGVNTDPLQIVAPEETEKETFYGLKVRQVPCIKINEVKEIKLWYEFGPKIGEGGFATVISVTEKSTSKQWAMKTVSKSMAGKDLTLIQREIEILKLIQHPHIIYLDKVFESSKNIYMIFEKCHGDFARIYNRQKPFVEDVARKIISELVDAVAYLHKYGIVHRDLKMENMLLGLNPMDPTDPYYVKLTDFGLSIVVRSGKGAESMLHEYCGTLYYMAPEIITLKSYSQTCDMWSIGVILYMLILGRYPFFSKKEKEVHYLICNQVPDFEGRRLSEEVKDLTLLLLVKEPVNRIRATEVLQHPWVQNRRLSKSINYNILEKMKEWKSEMKVETGEASDWASPLEMAHSNKACSKLAMNLPKTNISFDKPRKTSNPRKLQFYKSNGRQ